MSKDSYEKRNFPRLNRSAYIMYQVISPPDGNGNTEMVNISEGGIAFVTKQLLCPGLVLELSINLEKDISPILATAEVVWVKENDSSEESGTYLVGVKFINISLRDRDRLYYHLRKELNP